MNIKVGDRVERCLYNEGYGGVGEVIEVEPMRGIGRMTMGYVKVWWTKDNECTWITYEHLQPYTGEDNVV